jgi:hypothetical protein
MKLQEPATIPRINAPFGSLAASVDVDRRKACSMSAIAGEHFFQNDHTAAQQRCQTSKQTFQSMLLKHI